MRKKLVAGNWKMHLNLSSVRGLLSEIARAYQPDDGVDVLVFPPAIYLFPVAKALAGTQIAFGAQNLHPAPQGAFTGELSAEMIADTGAKFVLVGHSERRRGMGESEYQIHQKLSAAWRAGLTPILCVGETLEERRAGQFLTVLDFQVASAMLGLSSTQRPIIIAYEPVWAIGTGQNATAEQAQEAHAYIRSIAGKFLDAAGMRILYGGSLNPGNAAEIFAQPDIDGGLVGGASLKSESFLQIIHAARATG